MNKIEYSVFEFPITSIRFMPKKLPNWGAWIGKTGKWLIYGGSNTGLMRPSPALQKKMEL